MAKVPLNEKFDRMLRFLLSLNNGRVVRLLRARGFGTADRQQGWALFDRAAGRHLSEPSVEAAPTTPARALVAALDAWENTWFDVADATLRNTHPAVHERLFLNLAKTSGPQVVVTVGTLLKRLDALQAEAASAGDGDSDLNEALALLASRGLDAACRAEARTLLDAVEQDSSEEAPVADPAAEAERQQAIAEMWRWYKDWAQIARTVVQNKRDRITMGLSTIGRPKSNGSPPSTPTSPTPTPAG